MPVALVWLDRKSTRLNSSHSQISYAVFCLKKKIKHLLSPTLKHSIQTLISSSWLIRFTFTTSLSFFYTLTMHFTNNLLAYPIGSATTIDISYSQNTIMNDAQFKHCRILKNKIVISVHVEIYNTNRECIMTNFQKTIHKCVTNLKSIVFFF